MGAGDSGTRLDSRGKHFPRKGSLLAGTRAVFKPVVDRIDSLELQVGLRGAGGSGRDTFVVFAVWAGASGDA